MNLNGRTSERLAAWPSRLVGLMVVASAAGGLVRAEEPADRSESGGPVAEATAPAPSSTASPASAAPLAKGVDPQLLNRLAGELDDDRYGVREAAQKQLAAFGVGALETVAGVAAHGTLESSTRAVSVLLGWADGKDRPLSLAALEKLAALENRPTEAAMADERLAGVRELAAVEAVKELGGRFDYDRYFGMIGGPERAVQVIIGPQWTGGAAGLRHIADIRSATTLSLYSAPLNDDAIQALTELPQLKRMELYGTALSEEAIAQVQAKLPQTQLDVRRGGARLGVRGLNCEQVLPDSAAQKAGIKEQDKIIEFAGKPIEKFEELTELIAACKPGDSKGIKVQRLNPQTAVAETLELTVTFDRWGDDVRPSSGMGDGQGPFGPRPVQPVIQGQIIIQGGPGGVQRIQVVPQGQGAPANNRR
ncbi:MAG: PDZ domain-containing protein [Pirellulales bacterium]|nr:PDZ domain-containing protein [Pirellulales bacterium]